MTKSNHLAAFIPATSSEVFCRVPIKSTGDEFLKLITPRSQQKEILKLFQSENIVRNGYLKSIGIK